MTEHITVPTSTAMDACTVPVGFLVEALLATERHAAAHAAWARAVESYRGRRESGVPVEEVATLVSEIRRRTEDELFGLTSGGVPLGSAKLLGSALLSSRDLNEALDRLQEFSAVIAGMPTISARRSSGQVEVGLGWRADVGRSEMLLSQFVLVVLHRGLGWLIDAPLPVAGVDFAFPPTPSGDHLRAVFDAPVRFNAPATTLRIDDRALSHPVGRTDGELAIYLAGHPHALFTHPRTAGSVTTTVRRIYLSYGSAGQWPTGAAVAGMLSMSSQHLGRLLRNEGSTLASVRQQVKLEMAIADFDRGLATASTASRLGFSEPSAFHRAFKRWTGMPIGEFRDRGEHRRQS
jgi:AraC-like DNA-binding protein